MHAAHLPWHTMLSATVDARSCSDAPIFGEDDPIGFVQCLRRVLDGEEDAQNAHASYQKLLRGSRPN